MKKLCYLLFLLPFALFSACSDDDELAEVDLTLTLSGVTIANSNFFTVLGNEISIDGVNVKSLTDKSATITGIRYFFDGYPVFGSIEYPFQCTISTQGMEIGSHTLSLSATILQVDKTITTTAVNYPINIVEDIDDLPDGSPEIGTYSTTVRLQAK